jgi:hypothetical protein
MVDQIQAAVRRGDDKEAIEADAVLRAIDGEIWRFGNEHADAIQSGASNFVEPDASATGAQAKAGAVIGGADSGPPPE